MLTKKKFKRNFVDRHGFAIGDIVKFNDDTYDKENREFRIISRYSSLVSVDRYQKDRTESYALIDNNGYPPRNPRHPQKDGYEYFNKNYINKV